ncbi:MAG: ribbon-helix-helix domain-containing protein [Candidatus Lokiarchaeota archaeon]|nr:ribbon-helix-helix domain-containing protein [Candidatus Harpocratesius repetitus]
MKMLTVFVPEKYIESLDLLVVEEFFPNRSEAIRTAIRDLIRNELILKEELPRRKVKAKKS